jgi:hypothetical protein
MNSQLERWVVGGLLLVLSAGMILGLWFLCGIKELPAETGLPLLAISGVIALLVSIALVAGAFALFGLSDKTRALGLPEGSVRAVIALSLVVLFAVLTIYLYSDMSRSRQVTASNLTGDQKEEFHRNMPAGQYISAVSDGKSGLEARWTVYYRTVSPASEDFAKQLLVMIGTLVTSVASFYFGAKTAITSASASTPTTPSAPRIRNISPSTSTRGVPFVLTIAGDNLDLVKEAKLTLAGSQITGADLTSNASAAKCTFVMPATAQSGAWDVSVTDGLGRQATLPAAVALA